jgi:DNA-binding transcriptional ArsR family regulator
MDDVFRALSDPSRRSLLDNLSRQNGQTLRELCAGLDMARQSVSKHLAILEEAHLVTTQRRGREKLHFLNAAPINDIAERWINHYDRHEPKPRRPQDSTGELTDEQYRHFEPDLDRIRLRHIHQDDARATLAGVDGSRVHRRYWGVSLTSDWTVGSQITWEYQGVTMDGPEQTVLVADWPRRLATTGTRSHRSSVN